jgi:DNA adenine methylase
MIKYLQYAKFLYVCERVLLINDVKATIHNTRTTHHTSHNRTQQQFIVKNNKQTTKPLKIIPYIGCKSGFSHIFDCLIPTKYGKKIYDVFGGGGGFTFYACKRFGSKNIIYNDHNPVITNLIKSLKEYPQELHTEYEKHYKRSSNDYYLKIRKTNIKDGIVGAGRFYYLAKNAFSGKIRFNSKNEFNCPMRKNAKCPHVTLESLQFLSEMIKHLTITNKKFTEYSNMKDSFVYLDPPYMQNPNGHYNATVELDTFVKYINKIQNNNKIMISEQNSPDYLMLSLDYHIYDVMLNRSLQYFTQKKSYEIIAINYEIPKVDA